MGERFTLFFPSVTKILGVHDIQFSTIAGGEHLLNVTETDDVCSQFRQLQFKWVTLQTGYSYAPALHYIYRR